MRIAYSTFIKPIDENTPRVALREGEVKFDPDILRELLLHIEENATEPYVDMDQINLPGRTAKEVTYHVVLAEEAGLLHATIDRLPDDTNPAITHTCYSVHSIHFNGHELLGAIREPKTWRVIKAAFNKAGGASASALAKAAAAYLESKIPEIVRGMLSGSP